MHFEGLRQIDFKMQHERCLRGRESHMTGRLIYADADKNGAELTFMSCHPRPEQRAALRNDRLLGACSREFAERAVQEGVPGAQRGEGREGPSYSIV